MMGSMKRQKTIWREGTSLPESAGAHCLVEGVIVNGGKISRVAVELLYESNDKGGPVVVAQNLEEGLMRDGVEGFVEV